MSSSNSRLDQFSISSFSHLIFCLEDCFGSQNTGKSFVRAITLFFAGSRVFVVLVVRKNLGDQLSGCGKMEEKMPRIICFSL